jgi:hypothetical protein
VWGRSAQVQAGKPARAREQGGVKQCSRAASNQASPWLTMSDTWLACPAHVITSPPGLHHVVRWSPPRRLQQSPDLLLWHLPHQETKKAYRQAMTSIRVVKNLLFVSW